MAMADLKFIIDKSGFPLVWVEPIGAFIHWLPVTKVQFEYFLCAVPDSRFDGAWYEEILRKNPRISPNEIKPDNYWGALLSGIRPGEAQSFVQWLGPEYGLPTLNEWVKTYQYFKTLPPQSAGIVNQMGELRERVKTLIGRLNSSSDQAVRGMGDERRLADQMLMRMGVMEWVECPEHRIHWGGIGQTHPSFHGGLYTPDHGEPVIPPNPETDRLYYYGFRLIRREL
ncbi:MAG TPA: hypothetical protein VHY08_17850 [Bacillota bacterium]|nr:hypothetical protein [Bacillota bacterium]